MIRLPNAALALTLMMTAAWPAHAQQDHAATLTETAQALRETARLSRDTADRLATTAATSDALADEIAELPAQALTRAADEVTALREQVYDLLNEGYVIAAPLDRAFNALRQAAFPEETTDLPTVDGYASPDAPSDAPEPNHTPDLRLSREIGEKGIAAVQARLAAVVEPAPEDRFALAGLHFLGALEAALQARWQVGLSEQVASLPVLRLPIAANPDPQPLRPELLAEVLSDMTDRMAQARAPLAGLDDDFGLDMDLADIWFDVNANGARDNDEGLIAIAGGLLGIGPAAPGADAAPGSAPVIRFDTADAAWLSAYTHLMSGTARAILAYDPTGPIRDTLDTRARFSELTLDTPEPIGGFVQDWWMDALAIVLNTMKQQPDPAHARAAHADFLNMIAENRRFWTLVEQETDNTREWIPNAHQASATGIVLPPETGAAWRDVLSEVESVLNGQTLIPYWRGTAGVNIRQVFLDPRPVDLIGWLQGAGALPYLEQGPMASAEAMAYFNALMAGNGLLIAAWLN